GVGAYLQRRVSRLRRVRLRVEIPGARAAPFHPSHHYRSSRKYRGSKQRDFEASRTIYVRESAVAERISIHWRQVQPIVAPSRTPRSNYRFRDEFPPAVNQKP